MANIFQELGAKIVELVQGKSNSWSISQDKFNDWLQNQISMMDSLQLVLKTISVKDMETLATRYFSLPFNKQDKNDTSGVFQSLSKLYSGKTSSYEKHQYLFGPQIVVMDMLIKSHTEILSHIDEFVPDKELSIFNSKLSTVMLVGILQETDIFINYTAYLFNHFTEAISGITLYPMGYKAKYLHEYLEIYANTINEIINKEERYSFLKDVKMMKINNNDLLLYSNNQTFVPMLNTSKVSMAGARRIKSGIAGLNVIGWIMERWDDIQHYKYLKNKSFQEWLQNQAAILRLELQQMDSSSPQYTRLQKIIEAYDTKISEYDKKLSDYEKE